MRRALIEAGADVVFGHSGHVCRGVESHRGRPMLYCAGDFVVDYAVHPVERNDRSCVFFLDTDDPTGWRLRVFPTIIHDFQAHMAAGSAAGGGPGRRYGSRPIRPTRPAGGEPGVVCRYLSHRGCLHKLVGKWRLAGVFHHVRDAAVTK